MKKYLFFGCCILCILIVVVVLSFSSQNGEYYITDYESLYLKAIDYLEEEEKNSYHPDHSKDYYHFFLSYDGFGITEKGNYQYAYMWILGEGYYLEDGKIESSSGYSMFFKFTFQNNQVISYKNPEDGSYYSESIKKMCIDRKMSHKVLNYDSKLSNQDLVKEYYSKIKE